MMADANAESVWDYPRPPAVEACRRRLRIVLADVVLAESSRALRVLETSHPPTIYVPPDDVRLDLLVTSDAPRTWCEFKGAADYLDAIIDVHTFREIGWTYRQPSAGYEAIRDHIAFYPARVDCAMLDDERVTAQAGDFYGGWITSELRGPFKGAPGTAGW